MPEILISDVGQTIKLVDSVVGAEIARATLFLTDIQFYAVCWKMHISPEKFLLLMEDTLTKYQNTSSGEIKYLENRMQNFADDQRVQYEVIDETQLEMFKSLRLEELPLIRPLDWSLIQTHAGNNAIVNLKIINQLGVFTLKLIRDSVYELGVESRLAEASILARFISLSTKGEISSSLANTFFNVILSQFELHSHE